MARGAIIFQASNELHGLHNTGLQRTTFSDSFRTACQRTEPDDHGQRLVPMRFRAGQTKDIRVTNR